MNLDNQRLFDIKRLLSAYYHELDKADTISDCLHIKGEIDKLENEERQILARCKVEV